MLAGPIPINSKPFVYQKRGINVIKPAKNREKESRGSLVEKIFILFLNIV